MSQLKFALFSDDELHAIAERLKKQYVGFVLAAAGAGSSLSYASRSLDEICSQLTDVAAELEDRGLLNTGRTFSDEEVLVFRRHGRYVPHLHEPACGETCNTCPS